MKSVSYAAVIFVFACISWSLDAGASRGDPRVSESGEAIWLEEVAAGLKYPAAIAWLSDTDALIAERTGSLRILRAGKLRAEPVSGMPASVQDLLNGIKDVVVDPDYPSNKTLYLLIAEGTPDAHHAAVYRAKLENDGLQDVRRIYRSGEETSSGPVATRMRVLSDKTILVGLPVSAVTHTGPVQELDTYIGKIIRINRDGSVPPDNPFVRSSNARPEIWTFGHRVPLGLYEDTSDGSVWEVEAGPRGGDELNRLLAGHNYGWPKATWGFNYSGEAIASAQTGAGIEDPVWVWTPSITPSSIIRYRGHVYPQWDGDFFVGSLSGKALWRVRMAGNQVMLQEKLLTDLGERIRDVSVGPDGHLYVLTDHSNGRLLRLNRGVPSLTQRGRVARPLEAPAFVDLSPVPGNPSLGKQLFVQMCTGCHRVGRSIGGGELGPDLEGAYAHTAGARKDFPYSSAMLKSQRTWDKASLNAFLSNPSAYIPGTAMTAPPVVDAEVRNHLIAFLAQYSKP